MREGAIISHNRYSITPHNHPDKSGNDSIDSVHLSSWSGAKDLRAGAGYLLTLDRCHLLNSSVLSASLPVKVMMPGDFLKQIVTLARLGRYCTIWTIVSYEVDYAPNSDLRYSS